MPDKTVQDFSVYKNAFLYFGVVDTIYAKMYKVSFIVINPYAAGGLFCQYKMMQKKTEND